MHQINKLGIELYYMCVSVCSFLVGVFHCWTTQHNTTPTWQLQSLFLAVFKASVCFDGTHLIVARFVAFGTRIITIPHTRMQQKNIQIGNAYSFNYISPMKCHYILHMKIMGALFPNTSSHIFFKLLVDLASQVAPRGFTTRQRCSS